MKLLWIVGCSYLAASGIDDAMDDSVPARWRVVAGVSAITYLVAAFAAYRQRVPWLTLQSED